MTHIQPTFDHIVIEAIEQPKEKGGIIIPDKHKPDDYENRVVAVGPGKRGFKDELLPMPCAVGDTVLAHRNNGTKVTIDGKEYRIITSDNVMAVMRQMEPSRHYRPS